jgi:DNA-binding NtrC family response regulator
LERAEAAWKPEAGTDEATVLVVEDEVLIRMMLADALREQGLAVVEASDSDEALTVLQSTLPIRLLLTDIRMPSEIDGLALARLARVARPDLKVIVASSHLDAAFAGIADAFFSKPYNVRAVARRVKELLTHQHQAATNSPAERGTRDVTDSPRMPTAIDGCRRAGQDR